jgi:hypothetical protein
MTDDKSHHISVPPCLRVSVVNFMAQIVSTRSRAVTVHSSARLPSETT